MYVTSPPQTFFCHFCLYYLSSQIATIGWSNVGFVRSTLHYNVGPTSLCLLMLVQHWCSVSRHSDVGSTSISQRWKWNIDPTLVL